MLVTFGAARYRSMRTKPGWIFHSTLSVLVKCTQGNGHHRKTERCYWKLEREFFLREFEHFSRYSQATFVLLAQEEVDTLDAGSLL